MIILRLFGGLGNQMFQYAYGRATANRLGVDLIMDVSDRALDMHNGFELDRVFGIQAKVASASDMREVLGWQRFNIIRRALKKIGANFVLSKHYVEEPQFHVSPQMLNIPDNTYLSGYWQSEQYFMDITGSIRREFMFRYPASGLNEVLTGEILGEDETAISLHVRRGDYINNPTINQVHGSCSLEYYQAAIQYMVDRVSSPRFYVFSDDMDWVRANLYLPFPHVFVEHNRGKSSYEDMRLMSLCQHHIIANSSFSWWGAWLNPNPCKIVVAPQKWFSIDRDTKDLLPQEWVTL